MIAGTEPCPSVEVLAPVGAQIPIVATLPHAGVWMPPRYGQHLTVPVEQLWSDWHTAELYDFLPELGITTVCSRWSRFVADPNRSLDQPLFAPFGTGVISSTDTDGDSIYRRPLDAAEQRERIAAAHRPFHEALDQVIGAVQTQHERVLLLDLHSFGRPLDVDVVLGDGHGATATEGVVKVVSAAFERHGFTVARNTPYPGGWIVRRFADVVGVDAVQVELSQRRYLDPRDAELRRWPPPAHRDRMDSGRLQLRQVVADLTDGYPDMLLGHRGG